MKGKKKEEAVDTSNLPKINTFVSSIIFGSENQEKRIKLLDTIFKSNHKFLRLIPREQLIEFAKEKGIFVEPDEKKKDKKEEHVVEKRDINSEELAKAAVAIVQDRSIGIMKEKKALLEKIEELKKQKEEAIYLRDNPQAVDPKKKPDPKKPAVPVNPDEIIIPTIDDFAVELGLIFYNYPLDENELYHLDKENQALNQIIVIRDIDEYTPPEEPEKEDPQNIDPKAKKPAPAKDAKGAKDEGALLAKYFCAPPRNSFDIYYELKTSKYLSNNNSLLKLLCFEPMEFSTTYTLPYMMQVNLNATAGNMKDSSTANQNEKQDEEENKEVQKKDPFQAVIDHIADRQNFLNKYLMYYIKWSSDTNVIKLDEFSDDPAMQRKINDSLVEKMFMECDLRKKDFEHLSMGAILIAFYIDLVKHMREINHIAEHNMIIYEKNDVDNLFEKLENEIIYEYSVDTKASNNSKDIDINNSHITNKKVGNNNLSSHILMENQKEIEKQEVEVNKIDDLSSYFKLIIDEKDYILRNALDNEIERFRLGEREKAFNLFRKFPGIGRNLMPDVSPKEENFRKAKKCEIYPFLDNNIGIPIFEKYDIIKKFEDIFKEKINEYDFNFGNRIYQEIMNRDLLSQTLNNAMIYDTDTLFFYNERDDNLLFSTYYRCPKGRIYRKTNKYRYLSKPNLDNWITFFKPSFNEKLKKDNEKLDENLKSEHNNEAGATEINQKDVSRMESEANKNLPANNDNTVTNQNDMSNINTNAVNPTGGNIFSIPQVKVDKKPEIEYGNSYNPETDLLYDANDIYLGEITERIKYMFPSDNGVFVKKNIENGIFKAFNSYVKKDNLVFGIKKNKEAIPEFWLKFDNDVTMTVNYIGNYNSMEENYDSKNGTYTNFAFKNGLNIQILPNGEICQKIDKINDESLKDVEMHRIITSKASIISHYKMNKANIMYANGNVCTIAGGTSINTNNKGLRVAKRISDGFEYEMDPIAITIQSDPETNSNIII